MTGGAVAVLGPVGRNFAAGMTGGLAYVLDSDTNFRANYCGEADKRLSAVTGPAAAYLRQLLEAHHQATASQRALDILQNWEAYLPQFLLVVPIGEEDNQLLKASDDLLLGIS
jgi:glutamate synthase domain-containing protein 3